MDHFWLTDAQFAKIAPHLPTDTRGKERVDDRRVIIHVLKPGGPWSDAPREVNGPKKTLSNRFFRALDREGHLDRTVRDAGLSGRTACAGVARLVCP